MAEELVKASYLNLKVEAFAEVQKETINTIKEVETQITNLKDSNDSKLDSINEKLVQVSIKAELLVVQLQSMNTTLSSISENSALEWAIDHSNHDFFTYKLRNEEGHTEKHSGGILIRQILFAFRQGIGIFLPENATLIDDSELGENETKEFETEIVYTIHRLTGKKPIIKDLDAKRVIYYKD